MFGSARDANEINSFQQILNNAGLKNQSTADLTDQLRSLFDKMMVRNDARLREVITQSVEEEDISAHSNLNEGNISVLEKVHAQMVANLEFLCSGFGKRALGAISKKKNMQLMTSELLSLQELLNPQKSNTSLNNQLISFFDVQSRVHLLRLHSVQLGGENAASSRRMVKPLTLWKVPRDAQKKLKRMM